MRLWLTSAIRVGLLAAAAAAAPTEASAGERFPLGDGDIWVMVGDSITAQHLHSDYFEAFCFARYPRMTFRFRNAGTSGDTVPRALARFDWDVAAWKPTVVSVELGINDRPDFNPQQYLAGMRQLDDRIRALPARTVFFTSSAINNGETSGRMASNARLHEYAVALQALAAERHAPFADQFHALLDVWAKNQRSLQGDATHIGPPGQLMMAAALLQQLGADGFVSHAALDAGGRVVEARGCALEVVRARAGSLAFDRLDQSLPFPIAEEARAALALFPPILELSQYTLRVTGLKDGRYTLKINGVAVTTQSASEWDRGVNLTACAQGPLAAGGKSILAAVAAKEKLVWQWRQLARAASEGKASGEAKERLADLSRQVEAADDRIRQAAQPRKFRFELAPAP
jgi:hypothetical protein